MKQRNRARSSTLFLTELIIAILFFTVCSAVCVQFFVKSHTMSSHSQELNFAVNECSSVAEIIQGSATEKDMEKGLISIYPDAKKTDSDGLESWAIYFDSNFIECTPNDEDFAYYVEVDITPEKGMINCDISASQTDNENAIYSLEIKHNLQEVD